MFYEGKTTTENDYYKPIVSQNTAPSFLRLDLVNRIDTLSYAIVKNDVVTLQFSYLGRGNTLTYKKTGILCVACPRSVRQGIFPIHIIAELLVLVAMFSWFLNLV